jgi:hypothetical protein
MIKTSEQSWPAWQVKRRKLASLLPYAENARTHSDAQVKQSAASIAEWGWTMPVLVDEAGVLIAGHGRVLAAQGLGIADVPTMTASGWTAAQVKAYRLADNKLTLNAAWDQDLLGVELSALRLDGFDLDLTGFASLEVEQLLAPEVDPNALWEGMPEYHFGAKAHRSVIVHFKTPEDVADFAHRIGQEIGEKTKFIWHPEAERETLADKAWATDTA